MTITFNFTNVGGVSDTEYNLFKYVADLDLAKISKSFQTEDATVNVEFGTTGFTNPAVYRGHLTKRSLKYAKPKTQEDIRFVQMALSDNINYGN